MGGDFQDALAQVGAKAAFSGVALRSRCIETRHCGPSWRKRSTDMANEGREVSAFKN